MTSLSSLTPCLWFSSEAEEAARFYVSVFPDSRIVDIQRFGPGAMGPEGAVMLVEFELLGRRCTALNGSPAIPFTEAVSFMVPCDTQEEIDRYWTLLSEGGDPAAQVCGWLKDRYGLSWQIVPTAFLTMMREGNPAQTARMMQALMTMKKLDIAALEAAYHSA